MKKARKSKFIPICVRCAPYPWGDGDLNSREIKTPLTRLNLLERIKDQTITMREIVIPKECECRGNEHHSHRNQCRAWTDLEFKFRTQGWSYP